MRKFYHIKLPTCYWFSLCFAHELLMLLKRYINSLAALLGWIILLEHLYQSRYIYNLSLHNCWKCVLFRFISLPWQGSSNLDRPCHILLELVFYNHTVRHKKDKHIHSKIEISLHWAQLHWAQVAVKFRLMLFVLFYTTAHLLGYMYLRPRLHATIFPYDWHFDWCDPLTRM